jgi:flagellar L-ring protein FlgH
VRKSCASYLLLLALTTLLIPSAHAGLKRTKIPSKLDAYISQARTGAASNSTPGSLWSPQAPFAELATDYKARAANDLIVVRVLEQTIADATGSVKSDRKFSAESGFSGLFGQLGPRSGLQTLASPHSQNSLAGQAQASSSSSLQTRLSGYVAAVLPNGALVIEAARTVDMNNQRQTLLVRGVVRPGDVGPDNTVLSSALTDLEVELNGRGVISDGVRPPNWIVRTILKILEF